MRKKLSRWTAGSTHQFVGFQPVVRCLIAGLAVLLTSPAVARQGAAGTNWLDQPLTNWNDADRLPAAAPPRGEDGDALRARCGITRGESPAHRTLEEEGWTPYSHLDRELTRGDVELLAGMTAADEACQPTHFQMFVFVQGRFAGTLSPQPMTTGRDGSAGAVRIIEADIIRGEFARFQDSDAPCCPTSRMTVQYRIDRTGKHALVIPVDVRTTRG
ncbi:MAG: hypothetical protein GEV06_22225 [Luteitalea sp.]|nr:hypothetical protein [Luteitalea sp.]